MAKIKRRKSSKLFSSPRKKTRGSKFNQMGLVNSGIAVMSLLLVAFIFSFSERQVQSGVPIEVKFPSMPDTPKLATEIYESNPLLDIQVEILNYIVTCDTCNKSITIECACKNIACEYSRPNSSA